MSLNGRLALPDSAKPASLLHHHWDSALFITLATVKKKKKKVFICALLMSKNLHEINDQTSGDRYSVFWP